MNLIILLFRRRVWQKKVLGQFEQISLRAIVKNGNWIKTVQILYKRLILHLDSKTCFSARPKPSVCCKFSLILGNAKC